MRKYVNFYIVTIFVLFIITMGISIVEVTKDYVVIPCLIGLFFTIIMAIPMGNIKWHETHEQMITDQKESARIVRNCNKLIDQVKRELFRQSIMTKEEVTKILNKE